MRLTLLIVVLLAAPALALPDPDHHGGSGANCDSCGVGFGATVAVVDAIWLLFFFIADDHYFTPGWATLEIIWSAAQGLTGLIMVPVGAVGLASPNNDWGGPVVGGGLALLTVGVLGIIHGIKSIIWEFRKPPKMPWEAYEKIQPAEPPQPPPPPPSGDVFIPWDAGTADAGT